MNASLLKKMRDMGLTFEQAIELFEVWEAGCAVEPKPVSAAALRQRRYRAKQAEDITRDVTRDATGDATNDVTRDVTEPPLARVRDITSNSEIAGLAVVDVCAGERANDDWPKGDHVRLLVEAAASGRLDPAKSPGLATTAGRIAAWKRDGASWVHDVLPAVQAAVRKTGPPIGTWKYFDGAIAQSIADNRQALQIPPARHAPTPQPSAKFNARQANLARAFAGSEIAARRRAERQ